MINPNQKFKIMAQKLKCVWNKGLQIHELKIHVLTLSHIENTESMINLIIDGAGCWVYVSSLYYFYFYVHEVFHNNVTRIFSLVLKKLGLQLQIWGSSK